MRMKPLVVAVVAWVSVVAAASGVTWLVIDSAGQDLLTVDTPAAASPSPSPSPARSETRAPRPGASPSRASASPSRSAPPAPSAAPSTPPSPTPRATSSPQAPRSSAEGPAPAPPAPVSRSDAWTGAQGTVAVTCTRSRITRRSVTPNDGWHAEVEGHETGEVEVKFASGERETQVSVRCVAGVPRFRVEQD